MSLPRRKIRPRMKPVNPDRVDSKGHMKWVRQRFACAVSDRKHAGESKRIGCGGTMHAHHVVTRGSGGGDDNVVPLCGLHHDQIHRLGTLSFQRLYGVNLEEMAADLWKADQYHRAAWLVKARQAREMGG